MADRYVIRLIAPGWEEDVTAAIIGPFADGNEVAEALEGVGYSRSQPSEDPLTASWGGAVEVLPLAKEVPPPR